MHTKRPTANPYPPSNDRPRRTPLRSKSDSTPLHSPAIVSPTGHQARPIFLNGSGNTPGSVLAVKMVIESQRRAQTESRPLTPAKMANPILSVDGPRQSPPNHGAVESSACLTTGSTPRTYAAATTSTKPSTASRNSGATHSSGSKSQPMVTPHHVSFIPVSTSRTRAQATDSGTVVRANESPPSNHRKEEDWRNEKRVLERNLEEMSAEKERVVKENETLKRDLASRADRISSVEQALREEKKTSDALKAQLMSVQQASTANSERLSRVQKHCRELEEKNKGLEKEWGALKDKIRDGEEQRAHMQKLLESRTQELKSAQVFLTTTDKYSENDVLKLVASLNAEIFQTSAHISGLVEELSCEQVERLTWQQCLRQDTFSLIEARVGRELLDFIGKRGPDNRRDPFPLQLALQALLVWWSTHMVNSFCDNSIGGELATLYKHVQAKETQAVSARWRAITAENVAKFKQETYSSFIQYSIVGMLKMAGCCENPPPPKSAAAIQESIAVIEKIWKQIRTAVKEGVISSDIELVHGETGTKFDKAKLEDNYIDDGNFPFGEEVAGLGGEELVLCPVAIGVKRSTITSDGPKLRFQQDTILLKPKVVLTSALAHLT